MTSPQFNSIINGVINEAMKTGVAKGKMSTIDVAGILTTHVTNLLQLMNQAQAAAAVAHKQAEDLESAEIIIPFPKPEKKVLCKHENVIGDKRQDCGATGLPALD
jgi:hypothetical protein